MSELKARAGVFLVPAQHTAALLEADAQVAALEFSPDGTYAPPEWYVARHERFERLLALAAAYRILPVTLGMELAMFTTSVDERNRRAWQEASPSQRRELAAKHLAKASDPAVRTALAEVLSQDAGPEAGLWITTEAVPPQPPPAEDSEPTEDISPEELMRRLREYCDAKERAHSPVVSRRAFLCELSDEDARRPVATLRDSALVCIEETRREFVDGVEVLCELADVDSLARKLAEAGSRAHFIYSSAQARSLLKWLRRYRRQSASTALMRRVLEPAVANGHAFAALFTE